MTLKAFSTLTIKSIGDDGIIRGTASTPSPDRSDDIVEPKGAQFTLPIPLLWQHNAGDPIGEVIEATVTDKGIEVTAKIALGVTAEIDRYWQLIKAGLVRGFSIGFRGLSGEPIEGSWGMRFLKWEWLELSCVTVPANAEATIATVKHYAGQPAATGTGQLADPPGVSGRKSQSSGDPMKTIAQQIAAMEAKRAANAARMSAIMQKSIDEGRQTDAGEQEEFDGLQVEIEGVDADLTRLRQLQKAQISTATPVAGATTAAAGTARAGSVVAAQAKAAALPAGIAAARLIKVKHVARKQGLSRIEVARGMYGENSDIYGLVSKAVIAPGATVAGNWAADMVLTEGGAFADFLEFLRPQTIIGKLGTGGLPGLRRVPFNTALGIQSAGGTAYWVGEGKPKPLTKMEFDRTGLSPMKVATIAVTTEELLQNAALAADAKVRDDLARAVIARIDRTFIDPALAGVAGISPASVTNGVTPHVSVGNDAASIREDARASMIGFVAAENTLSSGVWIMSAGTALALSLMRNPLGAKEFPDMTLQGGVFEGLPVVVSNHLASGSVALISAEDIYLGDDGGLQIDMSSEASLEMLDGALGQDGLAGEGAELVSLWQNNMVAFRAERTISWKKARANAVALISQVAWGQPVTPPVGG